MWIQWKLFKKIYKNLYNDLFWPYFCPHGPCFTHNWKHTKCACKPVSCSHIKNFLKNWPKIYEIPIFTFFFKLKIPEKIRSKYQNSTSTTFWAILLCTLLQPSSLEERVECVKAWKEGLESKGLHVNMTKTQFMASGLGLDILQDSGKFPCAVCRTGVGRSSIRCSKCNLWVHYKKCSGLKTLSEDMSYECPRCRGEPGVCPIHGRPFKEVEVGDCVLKAVDRFCYLSDMLSAGGGCMAAATARCKCAWGKFFEKTFLCSRPSLCLSTWGVVCLALMHVVQCYMVRKLGPWLPTPFTDRVVKIMLWSAGFAGSSRRMAHQWTICMPS